MLQGFAPVVGQHARVLILGSMPGAASLRAAQYYAHPRNQFWPLLSVLWDMDLAALAPAQRHAALLEHGLGLWDVYGACRREGSLDRAIRDAEPNDLGVLRRRAPRLEAVAHNGATSARAAQAVAALGLAVHRLPSTSPAHAAWSFERKRAAWRAVFVRHGLLP
jgi:hypoxanthine-DNA glycosylase